MSQSNRNSLSPVLDSMESRRCGVLRNFVSFDDPGNSKVYALANPIPMEWIFKWIEDFKFLNGVQRKLSINDFKLGLNVVQIKGNEIDKEGLHVHLSHIIAIIFDGEGVLYWDDRAGIRHIDTASKGDCVVIPRGVMHYFTGQLSFAALEISDIIDYQKHHYINID